MGCCAVGGARTRPQYGGTLRVETQRDPWQGSDGLGRRLTMDGLTALDEAGAVRPALATEWGAQSGDHHWEFKLRGNVHFHDGSMLTAELAAASLARSCGTDCPWTAVRGVGQTVIFTGESPMPDLPAQLARAEFLISRPNAQGDADGTGPFAAMDAAPNAGSSMYTFTANDDYWGGRPFLDAVEVRGRRTVRDQWLDLSVGRADLVEAPTALLPQARQQHLTVIVSPPIDLVALQIASRGPLANEKLRQAIGLSVDRNALFSVIFQKQGEVTASLLPGYLSGYSFLFPTDRNLERSTELRGGASPPQLTLAAEDSSGELQLTADRIALNLREAGFRTQVVPPSQSPNADLVLRRISLEEADPRAALFEVLGKFGHAAAVNSGDAAELYRTERDFLGQSTVVPLLYLPKAYAVGERVRELRLGVDGIPLIGAAAIESAK
jgi:peptide/nickel transport system substrate-binding protein